MHTVKLTVLIDDPGDIDMEVRVVAPEPAAARAAFTTLKPRMATATRDSADDDYVLGGYAGI